MKFYQVLPYNNEISEVHGAINGKKVQIDGVIYPLSCSIRSFFTSFQEAKKYLLDIKSSQLQRREEEIETIKKSIATIKKMEL